MESTVSSFASGIPGDSRRRKSSTDFKRSIGTPDAFSQAGTVKKSGQDRLKD